LFKAGLSNPIIILCDQYHVFNVSTDHQICIAFSLHREMFTKIVQMHGAISTLKFKKLTAAKTYQSGTGGPSTYFSNNFQDKADIIN